MGEQKPFVAHLFLIILGMSDFFTDGFNEFGFLVFYRVNDEVVSRKVFELFAAKTAFKEGNAVKTVVFLVLADDTPEIVAANTAFSGVTHRLDVQNRGAGHFSAKLGRDRIMIRSLVTVKNHEILR